MAQWDQASRVEIFLFRALWLILTMMAKGNAANERNIRKWRDDYYNAGGGTIDMPEWTE